MGNYECDFCYHYAPGETFLEIETEEGRSLLKEFGIDSDNNADDRSSVQTMYAGAICPECGNYSSFDMDPDQLINNREILSPLEEMDRTWAEFFPV